MKIESNSAPSTYSMESQPTQLSLVTHNSPIFHAVIDKSLIHYVHHISKAVKLALSLETRIKNPKVILSQLRRPLHVRFIFSKSKFRRLPRRIFNRKENHAILRLTIITDEDCTKAHVRNYSQTINRFSAGSKTAENRRCLFFSHT